MSIVVDLARPESGAIAVEMRFAGTRGRAAALSSFIQPEALRLEAIEARQGARPLAVRNGRDEGGFARFTVAPPPGDGDVVVRYRVRPGAVEQAEMAGATGYRFGWLDARFGLFGARQVFLLPAEPAPPTRIAVRFRLPAAWTLATPWAADADTGAFLLRGPGAAQRLVEATLGAATFERSAVGSLDVCVAAQVPDTERVAAQRRAVALERYLAGFLGRPRERFTLTLVPKAPDGMSIAVAPGPNSLGLSIGPGLATRWLGIGRAIGRLYVAARAGREARTHHWVLEALPTWLATGFSERDRWRSRREWMERFYFDAGGASVDLARPDDLGGASEPLAREWRGALVLDLLDQALRRSGAPGLEERLRSAAGGRGLEPRRLVDHAPPEARAALAGWLAPRPYPFPFPGAADHSPVRLADVPRVDATRGGQRLDLYLGARNLGMLEQCGCRGQQAGGLARRATLERARLRGAIPSLAVELGDAIPFDQQAFALDEQKRSESDLAHALLAYSGVAASVVSHAELTYGRAFLAERVARLPHGFPLLSANVALPGLTPRLERRVGGVDLRVIGVVDPGAYHLGRALEYEDAIATLQVGSPTEGVARALGGSAPPGTLTIVAGALAPATVLEIARRFPRVAAIVTSDYFHFAQDPRFSFARPLDSLATLGRLDRTLVVVLRTDSYAIARLGLRVDPDGRVAAADLEALVLDESIADDPVVRGRLDTHYARLARESHLAEPAPIGARLVARGGGTYVGAVACARCHAAEARHWESTPHASAFATLLARRRQGLPGCFACHVTGYRQPTGYRTAADRALRNVQCESCHGPGSEHARAPGAANIVRDPSPAACFECHDPKHSEMTAGNFDEYRARVAHRARPD